MAAAGLRHSRYGAIVAVLVWCATSAAQETHGGAGARGGHDPHHTLGVFLGNSTEDRREEPRRGTTIGLEYEYRFAPEYGVGLVLERLTGDLDVSVAAVPFAYHRGPWKFYAAPGIEAGHGQTEALLRVGIEYGFHVGGFEISPQVDLDFVSGERVFVVGLVFARSL